jgi:hypothetical protein
MYVFYPNTSEYWIPPVDAFDPVDLDTDLWIQAAVAFQAKYAVLTTVCQKKNTKLILKETRFWILPMANYHARIRIQCKAHILGQRTT